MGDFRGGWYLFLFGARFCLRGAFGLIRRYGVGMAQGLNNPAESSLGGACPRHIP